MSDTSGFYSSGADKTLLFGPNAISFPDGAQLLRTNPAHANPNAPAVNGWLWFNSVAEAAAHFGVPAPAVPPRRRGAP